MSCNRNGETYVNTLVPVPGGSATDTDYVIDLTHYLCGNRKVCANSAFPISCNLNYQVLSVDAVGDAFVANLFISGQVNYKPTVAETSVDATIIAIAQTTSGLRFPFP